MFPPKLLEEIAALGGIVYAVGGSVRDNLRRLYLQPEAQGAPKDLDFVIARVELDKLIEILNRYGKTDLCGKSFGVIKFTIDNVTVDISLPRRELSTGPGHKEFSVTADPFIPIEVDLARRDFTMNAIANVLGTDELIDPFNGAQDIHSRQISVTYPDSFKEDPLRMLRACQFASRFGFEIGPETLKLIEQQAPLIRSITMERIQEELSKMLERSPTPSYGIELMRATGLLPYILPELWTCIGVEQRGDYHKWDVYYHLLKSCDYAKDSLVLRWAALLHDVGKPSVKVSEADRDHFIGHEGHSADMARKLLTKLKYPNDFVEQVVHLVRQHMFFYTSTGPSTRRFIKRIGPENLDALFQLRKSDRYGQGREPVSQGLLYFYRQVRNEMARKPPLQIKDLAINGHDLMKIFGLSQGPKVGELLKYLFEQTIDTPEFNDKTKLIELAGKYLAQHLEE